MWKLWNKLFGWQYALIKYGSTADITRVHFTSDGWLYYKSGLYYVALEKNNPRVIAILTEEK